MEIEIEYKNEFWLYLDNVNYEDKFNITMEEMYNEWLISIRDEKINRIIFNN